MVLRVLLAGACVLTALGACGPISFDDLRPGSAWREVTRRDYLAYENSVGPVVVTTTGMNALDDFELEVYLWVTPRTIQAASINPETIVLIEPDGREIPSSGPSAELMMTRVPGEPVRLVFEGVNMGAVFRRGCRLRIPVVPYDPTEGFSVPVEVFYRPK